jgi:hypothetical protein
MPETENKTVSTLLLRFGVKKKLIRALNPDRAKTKLIHRLSQQGVPEVLSTDEAVLIKGLGFEIPTTATISGTAAEAETSTATAVATLDTEEPEDDDDVMDTDPDDNDDDEEDEEDLDESSTATKGTNDPALPAVEKGNRKADKGKVKAKVKSPKPKKEKKESGRAVFRRLINSGKAYSRKSLVDKIVQECGCKACSVSGWISVSKKKGNAFGFVLSETGEKGKQTLEKK